ncbi:hypothetical protein [Streptomyces sp. ISL-11]|uniref:hypothetical protein n=1 Tax=Streptomyces sp. ISL-11 TaxID=2819174 RepID=UPI001BE74DEB|nr:hypothetical protein [Streptomyces sp. ISL-11]MBT2385545.1 hypothetical protein [Streptomyces sp. ISL-11]
MNVRLSTIRQRMAVGLAAVALSAAGLTVGAAAPAHAAVLNTCTGYETAEYNPGIHSDSRQTTVKAFGAFGTCVGDSTHTSGIVEFTGQGELSCTTGGSTSGYGKLFWADPKAGTSIFSFTLAADIRPFGQNVLIATGSITGGDYSGEPIKIVFALPDTAPQQCLSKDGVTNSAGPFEMTIGV